MFAKRNGIITNYTILVKQGNTTKRNETVENSFYNITGLEKYELYTIFIQALNSAGKGPAMEFEIRTAEDGIY